MPAQTAAFESTSPDRGCGHDAHHSSGGGCIPDDVSHGYVKAGFFGLPYVEPPNIGLPYGAPPYVGLPYAGPPNAGLPYVPPPDIGLRYAPPPDGGLPYVGPPPVGLPYMEAPYVGLPYIGPPEYVAPRACPYGYFYSGYHCVPLRTDLSRRLTCHPKRQRCIQQEDGRYPGSPWAGKHTTWQRSE
ncbi:MAG: hypothetical protein KGL35_28860 [Bradyrhizobium sp.]|uniref:hypothetical protein n=1 Tax=Bradyrhizobium sp. TaxID=376 RepID=UPI001C29007B|nr:hypothetical protein [Bradyrhizobium sp.]MBU6461113.1 hypothetical protein [Pseudomonadota bacterium]MDE2066189.1 hypothetical protein [Bradyrhizobium sp.]MDE2472629.1 hypothetical protein [Bradyrhizobium sp.]